MDGQAFISWILVISAFLVGTPCDAEETQPKHRIAIVSLEQSPRSPVNVLVDQLHTAFRKHSEIALLKRQNVHRILREKEVNLATSSMNAVTSVQVGELLTTDALLLLEKSQQGKNTHVHVRLDDTRYGIKLLDMIIPFPTAGKEFNSVAQRLARKVANDLDKIKTNPKNMLLVGVTRFQTKELSSRWDWMTNQIRRGIEQELMLCPDIIVLERDETKPLMDERLRASSLPSALRGSVVLLDGEYRLDHGRREIVVELIARNHAGEVFRAKVRAPEHDVNALGREVVRVFRKKHRRELRLQPMSTKIEAGYLAGMARSFLERYQSKTTGVRFGDLDTAICRVEAARSLCPNDHEHTLLLLDLLNTKIYDLRRLDRDPIEIAATLGKAIEVGLQVTSMKTRGSEKVVAEYQRRIVSIWNHYTNYARELSGSLINIELHLPRVSMNSDLTKVAGNFYMYRQVGHLRSRRVHAATLGRYLESVDAFRRIHPLCRELMNSSGSSSYLSGLWMKSALPCVYQFATIDEVHACYSRLLEKGALSGSSKDIQLSWLRCAIIDPWSAYYTWAPPIKDAKELRNIESQIDGFREKLLKHKSATVRMAAELKAAFANIDHDMDSAKKHYSNFRRLSRAGDKHPEAIRRWIVQLILTSGAIAYLDETPSVEKVAAIHRSIENHQTFMADCVLPDHPEMYMVFLSWVKQVYAVTASPVEKPGRQLRGDQLLRLMRFYLKHQPNLNKRKEEGWNRLRPTFIALLRSSGRSSEATEFLSVDRTPAPSRPSVSPEHLARLKREAEERRAKMLRDAEEVRTKFKRYVTQSRSGPMSDFLDREVKKGPFKRISQRRLVLAGNQLGVFCVGTLSSNGKGYRYAMLRLDVSVDPPKPLSFDVLQVSTATIRKPSDYGRFWTHGEKHRHELKFATAGQDIFVAAPGVGIAVFPNVGKPYLLSEENGLASNEVGEIASVGGKLYTQVGGIVSPDIGLMEVDVRKRTSRIIFSTRDDDRKSNLKGSRRVSGLAANRQADLLWMTINGSKSEKASLVTYEPTTGRFDVIYEPKSSAARDFRILGRHADQLFLGGHSGDLWLCDTKTKGIEVVIGSNQTVANFPTGQNRLALDGNTWLLANAGSGIYAWRPGLSKSVNISRACFPATSIYTGIVVKDWVQTPQGLFLILYVSSWSPAEGKPKGYNETLFVIPSVKSTHRRK